jgi:hypothetical protein
MVVMTVSLVAIARADNADMTETQKIAVRNEKTLKDQLHKKVLTLNLHANSFSDVIDYLSDVSGAGFFVDWEALDAAGVSREAPVTCQFSDLPLDDAIKAVFKIAAGDSKKLAYCTDGGILYVSTLSGVKNYQAMWAEHQKMNADKVQGFKPDLEETEPTKRRSIGVRFHGELDDLGKTTGAKTECDWDKMSADGIDRHAKLDVQIPDGPTLLAYQLIAQAASNEKATLDFKIEGDTIKFFSTPVKKK